MKTLHQFDEVLDTQAVFRKLLEAMSNPARTVSVAAQMEKLFGEYRAFLALGMTLLDNEVTFSPCGNEALRKDLQLVSLSPEAAVSDADYLFVTDVRQLPEIFAQAKCGTLIDPHKSATLREQQTYEYPMGVDLIFVTDSGDVTCIPRLVRRRDSQWHM